MEEVKDENVEMTENEQEEEQDNATFTQSEVDSQISKAVDSALKKREAKLEQEKQQAIEEAIAEKERLSKLSEKEKKDEELSKREKELNDRLAELERKELRADAIADLTQKGLPTEFADTLIADNAENTLANINVLKKAFDEAVQEAVKNELKGNAPKKASKINGLTKEEILNNKNAAERLKQIQNNPHLFN